MKKIKYISYFFVSLVFLYLFYLSFVYFNLFNSAKNINPFYNEELLRVKLYGSTSSSDGNTVSAKFSIIDSQSNEIVTIERSWRGSYLGVEFSCLKLHKKTFIFPKSIYGKNHIYEKKPPASKTDLNKYYNEDKQCLLYGNASSSKERHALYLVSKFANGDYFLPRFINTNYYSVDLSSCKNEVYYSICRNNNGDLYVREF